MAKYEWGSGLSGASSGAAIGSAILPGLGTAIGAGLGALFGFRRKSGQEKAMEELVQAIEQRKVLTPEERRIQLEIIKEIGAYTPELEQALELQEQTELAKISTDPRLRQAQLEALSRLERASIEGLTPEDLAVQREIQRRAATEAKGRREAVLSRAAERGMLGSGAQLSAELQAEQAAAEQAAAEGSNLAAQIHRRALDAALSSGQLAGGMEEKEHGRKAEAARALDAIRRFNIESQQGVQQRNIFSKNLAQLKNLQYKRDLAEKQAEARNLQKMLDRQDLIDYTTETNMKREAIPGAKLGRADAASAAQRRYGENIRTIAEGAIPAIEGIKKLFKKDQGVEGAIPEIKGIKYIV